MGGAKHRRKGDNVERQIVALHRDMGVHAERVPLSGASRYRGNGPMSIFMPTARMRVRWGRNARQGAKHAPCYQT